MLRMRFAHVAKLSHCTAKGRVCHRTGGQNLQRLLVDFFLIDREPPYRMVGDKGVKRQRRCMKTYWTGLLEIAPAGPLRVEVIFGHDGFC